MREERVRIEYLLNPYRSTPGRASLCWARSRWHAWAGDRRSDICMPYTGATR